MRMRLTIGILGLLTVLGLVDVCIAQEPAKSETEILAEREFQEGERLQHETSIASHNEVWELVIAGFQKANERYSRSRELYRVLGKPEKEAECLSKMGRVEQFIDNSARAVEHFQEAANIYLKLNKHLEAGREKANIGNIHLQNKKCGPARQFFGDALTAARASNDPTLEERALSGLGDCDDLSSDLQKAIDHWFLASKAAEAAGKVTQRAQNYRSIAGAYSRRGERQLALSYYSRAIDLLRTVDGSEAAVLEAYCLHGAANVYAALGDARKSIELELGSVQLLDDVNLGRSAAHALLRVATTYSDLNEGQNALKYCEQALDRFRSQKNKHGEAATLELMGFVYAFNINDFPKAQLHLDRSLALAREIKDGKLQAKALTSLGGLAFLQGDYNKDLEYKLQAYELVRGLRDMHALADALYDTGRAYYQVRDGVNAFRSLNLALLLYSHLDNWPRYTMPLSWLSKLAENQGNIRLATTYAKQTVEGYQLLRRNIAGLDQASQRSYLKSVEENYRNLARLLIKQGRLREAHQVLVTMKDEQLFDGLASHGPRRQIIALTDRELDFLRLYTVARLDANRIRERSAELNRRNNEGKATPEQIAELKQVPQEMGKVFQKFVDTVEARVVDFTRPEDNADIVPPLDESTSMWKALASVSQQTGQPTVAIYQLVSDNGLDSLIVSPNEIKHVSVPVKGLNRKARTFWALLQSERFDPTAAGKELYDVVFKPLDKELPANTKTILWSVDGNLRYVPMAALFDGKQYLLERYNHVTITRADATRITNPVSARWTATGLGSSQAHVVKSLDRTIPFGALPGVDDELNSLFGRSGRNKLLEGEVLLDSAFTQKSMLQRLAARRPVVHIASHFSFRPGDDKGSFLLLGDGTPFTLADMKKQKDMFAGVELLTLSACNTAAQQADANGREVDAFFELAQRLGAQSVLATLWQVADSSTPWLMREFYDLKVNEGRNKADALRHAQLALLKGTAKSFRPRTPTRSSAVTVVLEDETRDSSDTRAHEYFVISKKDAKPYIADPKRPFAHPFFWSPFVLIGNWR